MSGRFNWDYLRPGVPIFFIGTLLLLLFVGSLVFELPSAAELAAAVESVWARWGFYAVAAAYFFECLFVLSFYWPGSYVVLVSVALVSRSFEEFFSLWIALNVASTFAFSANILIGRYGFYKVLLRYWDEGFFEKYCAFVHRRGLVAIALTGVHANWLAMSLVAASAGRSINTTKLLLVAVLSHGISSAFLLLAFSFVPAVSAGSLFVQISVVSLVFVTGFSICELARYRRVQHQKSNRTLSP